MNLHDFMKQAIRTESRIEEFSAPRELLEGALEAYIAAGNMLDQIKKNTFYGSDFNLPKYKHTMEQLSWHLVKSSQRLYDQLRLTDRTGDLNNILDTTYEAVEPRTAHALIGMTTESTEIAESFLNYLRTGNVDIVNVFEETSDFQWYVALLVDEYNIDPYQPLENVINKLKARYPEKFTQEQAENRNLEVEREVLSTNLKDV